MNRSPRKRDVRRVTVIFPSIVTLSNLFFGMWSIVLATRGDFYRASWWIVIAGVLDMLDGRIARISKTGTRFGAELDSLVDLVSFGLAPALLISYQLFFSIGQFAWLFSYGFVVCVALRLARFNIQQSDESRSTFSGLPSPAAGMTLATYYPFTQTAFYQTQLLHLPWSQILIFLTIILSLATVSNVAYARLPRIGVKSVRGLLGLATHIIILAFGIWRRDIFFFPLGIAYVLYGLGRTAVVGFVERGEDRETREAAAILQIHDIETKGQRQSPKHR